MVGCFSGLTVAHTATLIAEKHKSNSTNNQSTVFVCVSDRTDAQREELQQVVSAMGCKSRHGLDVSMRLRRLDLNMCLGQSNQKWTAEIHHSSQLTTQIDCCITSANMTYDIPKQPPCPAVMRH